MIIKKICSTLFLVLTACQIVFTQQLRKDLYNNPDWTKKVEPFRLVGNIYYVGTYDLASYLVVTNKGYVLINTGTNGSASSIKKNIEKLGLRYKDIKILLTNQVHFDHVGGMAQLKKETGAKLMIEKADVAVMEDGGQSDFIFGGKGLVFYPAKVDSVLNNNHMVSLGNTQILVLHHPGHTKGATSYLLKTKDNEKSYQVLIANMPTVLDEMNLKGMKNYPNIGKDFAYTYDTMPKVHFDLWFTAHASQCNLFEKHKEGSTYNPSAFADSIGYQKQLAELKQDYLEKLGK